MKSEKKQVYVAGVKQNCYLTDIRPIPLSTPRPNVTQTEFTELVDKQLPNGFVQEMVSRTYPINAESVSSYIESSDYRNDPAQAIANAPKRVNLGDISEVQEFIKNNPTQAVSQYADILHKVASYFESASKNPPAPAPAPAPAPDNK